MWWFWQASALVVLLTAWLPMVLRELPLSLPDSSASPSAPRCSPFRTCPGSIYHPQEQLPFVEHMTELVVIISLMGAGLKLDRPCPWASWRADLAAARHRDAADDLALAVLGHVLLGLGSPRRCCWGPRWRRPIRCWPATSRSGRRARAEDEVRFP